MTAPLIDAVLAEDVARRARRRTVLRVLGAVLIACAGAAFGYGIYTNSATAGDAKHSAHTAHHAANKATRIARTAASEQTYGRRLVCRLLVNDIQSDNLSPAAAADTVRYAGDLHCAQALGQPHDSLPAAPTPTPTPGAPPPSSPSPPGGQSHTDRPGHPHKTPPPPKSPPPHSPPPTRPPPTRPPHPPRSSPPIKICLNLGPAGGCVHA